MNTTKYPRTYHLPFSEGLTNDDRKVDDDWWEYLKGKTLVLTEKLDGENQSVYKNGVYARSHSASTTNPWSKNMFEQGGIYDQVKNLLSEDEGIYGENMYAIHSIKYYKLPFYFHMFAIRNNERWYSWDEVVEMAEMFNIPIVPVLEKRVFSSPEDLKNTILSYMKKGSKYGDTIEGIVVRNADSFLLDDFSKNVVKYVRKNHVQTDEHWKKNWERAKLIYEYR
ncbi:MAG: RNA ligase family protein [Bacilli bacterium]|nr:RNA ligase family protein [Bacilli bacterium]